MADSLWPPRSLLGDARVDRQGSIEPDLWRALAFVGGVICDCCGVPMPDSIAAHVVCPACLAERPDVDHARAALVYDDLSRPLVLEMKHAGRQDGLPVFANWMQAALLPALPVASAPLIVPVPSHWMRLASRGFNQAARLGFALSRATGWPCAPEVLLRTRRTEMQKGKSASGRDRNVRGAFALHKKHARPLAGATIVLVDDVYTTGATLNACARVLKRAGGGPILAVALARVVRPRQIDGLSDDPALPITLV